MYDRELTCLADAGAATRALYAVRPDGVTAFLAGLGAAEAGFVRDSGFAAVAQEIVLIPGATGVAAAVLGLGNDRTPYAFGDLSARLPAGTDWHLIAGDYDTHAAVLGFCLGAYRYAQYKPAKRAPARLAVAADQARALSQARATWMVRDLINAPANLLGPSELADAAMALAARHGAKATRIAGEALAEAYPTVAAVGAGSARAPVVVSFTWAGAKAAADAPLLSLCGKGVCFDTGGYDLKPSAGMLRMKKDMGGAANVLGIARVVMEADLPIRLAVRVGCVENSVSGTAMRPMDVLKTRRGLTVEVGNTDAEGRLVLCDLLAEASDEKPALLVDCATLTGAARVATGPDLPAFFCNDDGWAETVAACGRVSNDPLWRLPLFDEYDPWLNSSISDINNVSSKPFAGAIVAALFLRRFVAADVPWVHIDMYGWNDQNRPGRPEGGESQSMRAIFETVVARLAG